jgi:hypothetical protein
MLHVNKLASVDGVTAVTQENHQFSTPHQAPLPFARLFSKRRTARTAHEGARDEMASPAHRGLARDYAAEQGTRASLARPLVGGNGGTAVARLHTARRLWSGFAKSGGRRHATSGGPRGAQRKDRSHGLCLIHHHNNHHQPPTRRNSAPGQTGEGHGGNAALCSRRPRS